MSYDGDFVVDEVPIYLSNEFADNMFIYQYSTFPNDKPIKYENVTKCSIKPENQQVLLEFGIDTQSHNYDYSHGEQISVNVDGVHDRPDKCFKSSLMDKTTMESSKVNKDLSNTAIAMFSEDRVVLTPVKGILNIQPGFPYLDLTDKRTKDEHKEHGADLSSDEEEKEKEKHVTVKFMRPENEKMKRARERSFNYLSKKCAEEPWYDTVYCPSDSHEANVIRQKLSSSSDVTVDESKYHRIKKKEYVGNLLPQC